ncbi:MAG: hypothetical protein K9L95_01530 [Candidatus Omnitrophica bacterium]|nr:hypothetical protein [Candidatus Omnitrophota bacterium]MCF7877622.1 hypothetical protein [Candidatus Omnitrophota bacterium]MCF7878136.1 hypothetical protein [Candidatus Omnitrophota bacterium]MCF7893309.1 hypothetical protein [Candidatus Omnitrophota bacterium]
MPYNADLDKELFAKAWEGERTRIRVRVFSYNQGEKKVQITRENKDNDDNFRFTKLGRLTKEELEGILPLVKEALGQM